MEFLCADLEVSVKPIKAAFELPDVFSGPAQKVTGRHADHLNNHQRQHVSIQALRSHREHSAAGGRVQAIVATVRWLSSDQ